MIISEYRGYIKDFFSLAEVKKVNFAQLMISAILYKGFAIMMPFIGANIVEYLSVGDKQNTYFYLVLLLIDYILYNVAYYWNYKAYAWCAVETCIKAQTKIYSKLTKIDNNFTRKISKARIMSSISSDVVNLGDLNDYITEMIAGIIQVFIVIVVVFCNNFYIGVLLLVFAFFYVKIRDNADRKLNFYHEKSRNAEDKYGILVNQTLAGLQEIKTFNIFPKLVGKLSLIQRRYTKNYLLQCKYWTIRDNDIKFMTYGFRFVIYLVSIFLMSQGNINLGALILIISYHESITSYLDDLISATVELRFATISTHRINKIINYRAQHDEFGDLDLDDINGIVEFKNVSLQLEKQTILKNISFKAKKGKVLAIVGEPGAGKTKTFDLLLRLHKPTKGKILIDGIDVKEFTKKVYSTNVAIANQKPFIFDLSIRKNLDFVDPNIEHQEEACKIAGIHNFIKSLPNGYNTILRENGSNISGGQKQLISIARTILSEAEIMLLDDVTTALDPDTATMVPGLVEKLKKDHTVIMITKKPDLMSIADHIIVLDKGRISDEGTHKQLMKRSLIYRTLQSRNSPSKEKTV